MSKHEPECVYFELLSACDCDRVRRAYQRGREDEKAAWMSLKQIAAWLAAHDAEVYRRGREDAAKAVEEAVSHKRNETIMLPTYPPQSACVCGRVWPHVVDPVAAARGDGERA